MARTGEVLRRGRPRAQQHGVHKRLAVPVLGKRRGQLMESVESDKQLEPVGAYKLYSDSDELRLESVESDKLRLEHVKSGKLRLESVQSALRNPMVVKFRLISRKK